MPRQAHWHSRASFLSAREATCGQTSTATAPSSLGGPSYASGTWNRSVLAGRSSLRITIRAITFGAPPGSRGSPWLPALWAGHPQPAHPGAITGGSNAGYLKERELQVSSTTGRTYHDVVGGGWYMRTVNGGVPERIPAETAVGEAVNARAEQEDQKHKMRWKAFDREVIGIDTEVGAYCVRIDYHDVRGVVELRPATLAEASVVVMSESERYTSGERVIVRGVYYQPETRTHHVLPEYEGEVVNWHAPGHYYVRAVAPDDQGADGVRQCQVRELRSAVPADVRASAEASGLALGDLVEYDQRTVLFLDGPQVVPGGRGRLVDVFAEGESVVARIERADGTGDAPLLSDLRRSGHVGTLPEFEEERPSVRAALESLEKAGEQLAVLTEQWDDRSARGAFLTPDHSVTGGVRVLFYLDGEFQESVKSRRDAKRRQMERASRRDALHRYARILRSAGWTVTEVYASRTATESFKHLVAQPPPTSRA